MLTIDDLSREREKREREKGDLIFSQLLYKRWEKRENETERGEATGGLDDGREN